MGELIFRCPETRQEFKSGFQATWSELKLLPPNATISLRCSICGATHEFEFVHARIDEKAQK